MAFVEFNQGSSNIELSFRQASSVAEMNTNLEEFANLKNFDEQTAFFQFLALKHSLNQNGFSPSHLDKINADEKNIYFLCKFLMEIF